MIRPPRFTAVVRFGIAGVAAILGTSALLSCSSSSSGPPGGSGGARASGGTGGGSSNTGGSAATGGAGGAPTPTGGTGASPMGGISPNGGRGGTNAQGGAPSSGGGGGQAGKGGNTSAGWSATFPKFMKRTLAPFSSGYAMTIADIDKNGKPDVIALSSAGAGLAWFENPTWTKYAITTKAKAPIFTAPYDADGDGDVDLAVAHDFAMNDTMAGGTISWLENPGNPVQMQDWALHKVDAIPTTHRVRWGDLDGNGKKELLALPLFGIGSKSPAYAGAVQLKAYTIPSDPKTGTWAAKVLDDKRLEVAHGLMVVDWDGDKAEDILTAANNGVDLFRPSLGNMAEHIGDGGPGQAPNKGSSEVVLGRLAGARFVATIDPWHGTNAVIYTPGASASAPWVRNDLGADFEHGHGMAVADFNNDGYDEVVGGGGQGNLAQIIYRYVPSSQKWEKVELDKGSLPVSCIDVSDLDGDGDVDIVSIGGSTIVWYENLLTSK